MAYLGYLAADSFSVFAHFFSCPSISQKPGYRTTLVVRQTPKKRNDSKAPVYFGMILLLSRGTELCFEGRVERTDKATGFGKKKVSPERYTLVGACQENAAEILAMYGVSVGEEERFSD